MYRLINLYFLDFSISRGALYFLKDAGLVASQSRTIVTISAISRKVYSMVIISRRLRYTIDLGKSFIYFISIPRLNFIDALERKRDVNLN